MPEEGTRVYALADHPSDQGATVLRGEAGYVVGYRGLTEIVVSWDSGDTSVIDAWQVKR